MTGAWDHLDVSSSIADTRSVSRATPCFELALTRVRRCRSGSLSLIVKALIIRMKHVLGPKRVSIMATRRAFSHDRGYGFHPRVNKRLPQSRLTDRARERWPALTHVTVRFRGGFAYVTGHLPGNEELPLCRFRYGGSGMAVPRAYGASPTTVPATKTTKTPTSPTG